MADFAQSTIVGPSILINGSLQGDEDLTVLGRVEGTIRLTRTLNVEESGIVKADISVRNAVISGVVVGNINATDSVEITEAGRMVGDIRAPRVIIVDGARFRGAVDMGDMEAQRPSGPLPARTSVGSSTALSRSVASSSRPSSFQRKPPPPPPPSKPAETKVETKATSKPKVVPVSSKKIKKRVVVKKKG